MKIHSVSLEMIYPEMMSIESETRIDYDSELNDGDSLGTEFILRPLKVSQDTNEYGDVLVEWS